jgi:hypothetical protein
MTKGGSLPKERKKEELRRKKSAFSELFLRVPCVLGAKFPNSAPSFPPPSDFRPLTFDLPTSDLPFLTPLACSPAPRSMLLNSLYFRLKPLIPRSIQLGMRRRFVLRKREQVGKIWPIMPGSEQPPKGWLGWPGGKQFAFVLTHDVEGQRGVDRVKELAELEMELGFRSSFNFVPEGAYIVPASLRAWLTNNGFEVGVHDLNHDGHLFSSQESFQRKAQRINSYLEKWNAVGFRSAYMLRNLEWIKKLDIAYDTSTFDTDPFEPQPDGVNTIFPFWVPRGSEANSLNSSRDRVGATVSRVGHPATWPHAAERDSQRQPSTFDHPHCEVHAPSSLLPASNPGYVELPYTLAQDSTCFLVLREPTIRLWKKKLDWIADHGGMALLNVHPDFIAFADRSHSLKSYPAKLYAEFLSWVKQKYGGEYWHARPAFLGKFVRPLELPKTNLDQVSRGASNGAPCMLGSWRTE